jgi:bifunctional non-homologous end joining protein LigD
VEKPFCRAFAGRLSREQPERFLSTVKKADRKGKILIDWLRNGLGATAVASFSPRARPGASVATPLDWDEVVAELDPSQFTLRSTPDRLARKAADGWRGFEAARRPLPDEAVTVAPLTPPRRGRLAATTTAKPKRAG